MFWKSKVQHVAPVADAAELEKIGLAEAYRSILERTQATIQFHPDGTIITANENFLRVMGYSLGEIVGKHHRIFMMPDQVGSQAYQTFWSDLGAGKSFVNQFQRLSKSGAPVWLHATYAPYMDAQGKVTKIIKIANDISERQKGIDAVSLALEQLSRGDLTHRIGHCGTPDMALLARAFNSAVSGLDSTLAAVGKVSQSVTHAAEELRHSSAELSQRTESQAAALTETAAAIGALTTTIKETAKVANSMESAADAAVQTAEGGGKVVHNAISAMSNIEHSSKRIAQIISVINDIAFQTNLLALNAGVEAARAGDAGRGFAVVASEVRILAQRSAEAANEIKVLIADSSRHVATGVDLVGEAGKELQKIITGVGQIHAGISDIARGTTEQSVSLVEINSSISHLDMVTQRNAAMVEGSTGTSEVLAKGAHDLAHQVASFQTSGSAHRAEGEPFAALRRVR